MLLKRLKRHGLYKLHVTHSVGEVVLSFVLLRDLVPPETGSTIDSSGVVYLPQQTLCECSALQPCCLLYEWLRHLEIDLETSVKVKAAE